LSTGGSPMSGKRYTPEFKDEAVRQIIEAGHSVTSKALWEVARIIGDVRDDHGNTAGEIFHQ
jgi:transposase-like protein